MKQKLIIIGFGMVAKHFCDQFIKLGLMNKYDLIIFSKEKHLAYDRVQLTTYARNKDFKSIQLSDEKWFKKGNTRLGFTVLIAIGIAMCLPKLLRPLHYDKGTLREAASWLAENSEESDVIGSVDPRIGFYAERNSVHYDGIIVPQEVKYLVRIFKKAEDVPADDVGGYRKVFSFEGDVKKRLVVIYENPL